MMKVCPIRPLASYTLMSDQFTGQYKRLHVIVLAFSLVCTILSVLNKLAKGLHYAIGIEG